MPEEIKRKRGRPRKNPEEMQVLPDNFEENSENLVLTEEADRALEDLETLDLAGEDFNIGDDDIADLTKNTQEIQSDSKYILVNQEQARELARADIEQTRAKRQQTQADTNKTIDISQEGRVIKPQKQARKIDNTKNPKYKFIDIGISRYINMSLRERIDYLNERLEEIRGPGKKRSKNNPLSKEENEEYEWLRKERSKWHVYLTREKEKEYKTLTPEQRERRKKHEALDRQHRRDAEKRKKQEEIYREAGIPLDQDFWGYAEDVRDEKILTGEFVRKACEISLEQLTFSKYNKSFNWYFDYDLARQLAVYLQSCRHIKDIWAAKKEYLKLEPWQLFFIGQLNGWREKDNKYKKRYREFILECAKKQGKTFLGAGISLYNTQLDAEGAEVYSVARQQDQAKISWDAAFQMAPKLKNGTLANRISMLTNVEIRDEVKNSFFKPLSKETKSLEGKNPSFVLFDEAAAVDNDDAFTVMLSGMASRMGPQALYITTPQFLRTTLYYKKRSLLAFALRNNDLNLLDRLFGLLYCLDDEDDWHDVSLWAKSNPNLGVSVTHDYLLQRYNDAMNIPTQRNEVLIHHAGRWVGAADSWMSADKWNANKVEIILNNPEDKNNKYIKENMKIPCFTGVDLARLDDLCGVSSLFGPYGDSARKRYDMSTRAWIPEIAYKNVKDEERTIYDQAIDDGVLTISGEELVDYEEILKYLLWLHETYDLKNIGFDPHNATIIMNILMKANIPCIEIMQTYKGLNAATKAAEMWILEKRLRHLGHPFIAWQLENCVCKPRSNEDEEKEVKLEKANKNHSKIDNIAAMINAIACIDEAEAPPSMYELMFMSTDNKGLYWIDQNGDKHRELPDTQPVIIEPKEGEHHV